MAKTTVYLVRHGETDYNKVFRFMGRKDIPLNKKGISEAKKLKDYFRNKPIDCLYSSPLKRAMKTANIINQFHELKIKKAPGLREINFGKWEGLNYKSITKSSGKLFAEWITNPMAVNIPGGENMKKFAKRAVKAFKKIVKLNKGKTILIVTHGGTMRAIMIEIFGVKKDFIKLAHNPGCIDLVELGEKSFKIKFINYTKHLK